MVKFRHCVAIENKSWTHSESFKRSESLSRNCKFTYIANFSVSSGMTHIITKSYSWTDLGGYYRANLENRNDKIQNKNVL